MQIVDQHQDADPGVAPTKTEVVQPAVVAQGDDAAGVHPVVADPVVQSALPLHTPTGHVNNLVLLFGKGSACRNRVLAVRTPGRSGYRFLPRSATDEAAQEGGRLRQGVRRAERMDE